VPRNAGISGLAVALATAGGFLVYAGIRDVPLLDGARELVQGKIPTPRPKPADSSGGGSWLAQLGVGSGASLGASVDPAAGSVRGDAVVNGARRYLGVPYRFGGNDPATGIDCSRLVQLAYAAAGVNDVPRTSALIAVWPKVHRAAGPPAPGDILWWMGHVAIASGASTMIEAPTWGIPVRETTIRKGATILRYQG